jgi:cyclic lactone autoinducer peptide
MKKQLLSLIGTCSLFVGALAVSNLKMFWWYQPKE